MFSSIFCFHYVFLKDVPQPLQPNRGEERKERGGGERKKCFLIDLLSTRERLVRNIIWVCCAASTIHKQYSGPYFWGTYTHTPPFNALANTKDRISESAPLSSSTPALSVLHLLPPTRSRISQPNMFDYNTNGCLRRCLAQGSQRLKWRSEYTEMIFSHLGCLPGSSIYLSTLLRLRLLPVLSGGRRCSRRCCITRGFLCNSHIVRKPLHKWERIKGA